MAAAWAQGKFAFADANSQASLAVTFTSNVTAGSVIGVWAKFGTVTSVFNNITDSFGSTYTTVDTITNGGGGVATIISLYAKNVTGGACTVTLNFTGSTGVFPRIMVHEYSGVDTSNPLNAHSALNQDNLSFGTDNASSNPGTTTVNGCVVGGYTVDNTNAAAAVAAGTGFTIRTDGATPSNNFDHSYSESLVQGSAGAIAALFSPSGGLGVGFFTTSMMAFQPPQASAATTQSHGFVSG